MTQIQVKLKERLEELKMRPSELARRAGIPASSVKNLLYGKVQQPREDLIGKITKVLRVNPEYLLYGIKQSPANQYSLDEKSDNAEWDSDLYKKAIDVIDQVLVKNHVTTLSFGEAKKLVDQLYVYANKKTSQDKEKSIDIDVADCLVKIYLNS